MPAAVVAARDHHTPWRCRRVGQRAGGWAGG
jgi:hypothetical protein